MKTKKGYHLFIMLTILIAHTLILSSWLSNSEAVHVQKQANFKLGQRKGIPSARTFKSDRVKDSVDVGQTIFSTTLSISAK